MSGRRLELVVTGVLLVFALAYGARMATYPDSAGMVPALIAAILVVALVVQLVQQLRSRDRAPAGDAEPASGAEGPASGSTDEPGPGRSEPDSYDTLITLDGKRRHRFLAIAGFCVGFVVGTLLAGFVITSGVLITLILLHCRERLHVVVISGVLATVGAYALISLVLGLPALSGALFG